MAHHTHEILSKEETFEFTSETKRKLIIASLIGVAMVALGAFLLSKGWSIGVWESHGAEHAAALRARQVAGFRTIAKPPRLRCRF